jgi:hypothetical protein
LTGAAVLAVLGLALALVAAQLSAGSSGEGRTRSYPDA